MNQKVHNQGSQSVNLPKIDTKYIQIHYTHLIARDSDVDLSIDHSKTHMKFMANYTQPLAQQTVNL